jgi:hypothetical protein
MVQIKQSLGKFKVLINRKIKNLNFAKVQGMKKLQNEKRKLCQSSKDETAAK